MEFKFDPENPKYEYITERSHYDSVIKELENVNVVSVDTETTGFDPHTCELLLFQISTPDKSYIIDARALDLKSLPEIKDILEDQKKIKLLQNAKFDYKFIKKHTGIEMYNIYDTMLAEGVLTAGLSGKMASLKNLTKDYLGLDLDKNIRKSFVGLKDINFSEEQLKYAAIDTFVLFPIFDAQIPKLRVRGVVDTAKIEFAVTKVIGEMELRGVYIDRGKWSNIIKNLKVRRDELTQEFYDEISGLYQYNSLDLFGNTAPPININSNVQLLELFNNRVGLNLPSTGDPILETVNHPIVKTLREYRKYEKLISAFGESLLDKINPVTKRIHPQFNQMGAATGRFSCNNPNLQQIPRNQPEAPFRECFNPAEGYKFVISDYSSMEMRILADLSGDEKFISAIKNGYDLHSYTAALMFGLEYSEDFKKKHADLRQAAKAINFGLMYGMGPGRLAAQINVTPELGKEYMEKYFSSYPSVRDFLKKVASEAVRNGYSATPGGRKRWYKMPDKSDPDYKKLIGSIERQAKNHPIQGTNADAMKFALVSLYERLKREKIDAYILLSVHDEIVTECNTDFAEEFKDILSEEMVKAAEVFVKKVPIASDPFVGDVWEH
jgi:DNA polymerase I-like protein with 3'-5' exonuclease and polymerase domains